MSDPTRAMRLALVALCLGCADGSRGKSVITPPDTTPDRGDPLPTTDAVPDLGAEDAGPADDAAPDAQAVDAAPAPDAAADAAAPDADPGPDPDAEPGPEPDVAIPDGAAPDAPPPAVCGDGQRHAEEACDDGNQADGDYCSADCARVTGSCGDGVRQDNEGCDDGAAQAACDQRHDGGDGVCRPLGQCSPGFEIEGQACVAGELAVDVNIFVDNFCNMRVEPESVVVGPGQTAAFRYRNRSRDYPVDVWMSYGGGYLDLAIGDTWDEPIIDCAGDRVQRYFADISTACSEFRFHIECQ